jgi:tetratricopeptide (TPR) repeat protein
MKILMMVLLFLPTFSFAADKPKTVGQLDERMNYVEKHVDQDLDTIKCASESAIDLLKWGIGIMIGGYAILSWFGLSKVSDLKKIEDFFKTEKENIEAKSLETAKRLEELKLMSLVEKANILISRGDTARLEKEKESLYQQALAELESAEKIQDKTSGFYGVKSYALKHIGKYPEALDAAKKAYELAKHDPEKGRLAYNIACYASILGRVDEAIEYLPLAIKLSPTSKFEVFAKTDDDFKGMKENPEFKKIVG